MAEPQLPKLIARVRFSSPVSKARARSDIAELNIPTGVPRAYELDDALRPISASYLGDAEDIAARAAAVAAQAASARH